MIKIGPTVLALCAAGVCAAQTHAAAPQPAASATKHFRLTFVLTYPEGQQPSQSFVLDVPVVRDRPSETAMSTAAALTGKTEGSVQQTLQCSNVRESSTGLAARVEFVTDSVLAEPLPGMTEPLHRHLVFQKQIDIALAKPTRITDEMHMTALKPLRPGDDAPAVKPPAAPQITVTAVEM